MTHKQRLKFWHKGRITCLFCQRLERGETLSKKGGRGKVSNQRSRWRMRGWNHGLQDYDRWLLLSLGPGGWVLCSLAAKDCSLLISLHPSAKDKTWRSRHGQLQTNFKLPINWKMASLDNHERDKHKTKNSTEIVNSEEILGKSLNSFLPQTKRKRTMSKRYKNKGRNYVFFLPS